MRAGRWAAVWFGLAASMLVSASVAGGAPCDPWRLLTPGKPGDVSGLAVVERNPAATLFLAVSDVKKPATATRARLVVFSSDGTIGASDLAWPADAPVAIDLEAATPLPGEGEVLLAASNGDLFRLRVRPDGTLAFGGGGKLPPASPASDVEGLAVRRLGGRLVVVWGNRGEGTATPGVLSWGGLSFAADGSVAVAEAGHVEIRVPFPDPALRPAEVRHLSDLALAPDGTLYSSAARDPGDDGPFESAVYRLGRVVSDTAGVRVEIAPSLVPLRRFDRKVEAIAGGPCGLSFGTDDENQGGWVLLR